MRFNVRGRSVISKVVFRECLALKRGKNLLCTRYYNLELLVSLDLNVPRVQPTIQMQIGRYSM